VTPPAPDRQKTPSFIPIGNFAVGPTPVDPGLRNMAPEPRPAAVPGAPCPPQISAPPDPIFRSPPAFTPYLPLAFGLPWLPTIPPPHDDLCSKSSAARGGRRQIPTADPICKNGCPPPGQRLFSAPAPIFIPCRLFRFPRALPFGAPWFPTAAAPRPKPPPPKGPPFPARPNTACNILIGGQWEMEFREKNSRTPFFTL